MIYLCKRAQTTAIQQIANKPERAMLDHGIIGCSDSIGGLHSFEGKRPDACACVINKKYCGK